MPIAYYLIMALAKVVGLVINIYTMVVVIAALITWVNPDPYNPIVRILYGLTQPAFRFVRRCMPGFIKNSRIDISPIVVLLLLVVIETVSTGLLTNLAVQMIK